MISIQTISLLDLLPPNLRIDPNISAAAQAIDEELQGVTSTIQKLSYFERLDSLTEEETDELAWQFHVDFYDPELPIEQRRELVKNSFRWHRRKGTPSAVEELVQTIFGDGSVQEWWEYSGLPYTFRVISNNRNITGAQINDFTRALNTVKNIRSRLDQVVINYFNWGDLDAANYTWNAWDSLNLTWDDLPSFEPDI